MASLNWPDHDLPIICLEGSRLLGPLSPLHIFRPAVVEPLVSLKELLVSAKHKCKRSGRKQSKKLRRVQE